MSIKPRSFAFHPLSASSNGVLLSSLALLFVFASSCGSDKKKAGTGSGTVSTGNANENVGKSADISVNFPKLTTDAVIEEKSVYHFELVFPQNAGPGKWSLFVSERENGFVGAIPVAKDLPLSQAAFEWNTANVAPSRYYVTIAVEYAGEIRLFQAPGVVVVTSKGKNAQPYARIIAPNNTFTINNNNEVQPINNNNARQRFSAGEPVRIRYKYLEPEGEAVTLSLQVSSNNRDWKMVLEKFSPGQPVTPGGDEYIVEWTPPADIDKNVYILRLGISDGKSETFTDQPNIGIGDISYSGEISALLTKNCASAGCHDAATNSGRVDLTRYDNIPQVNVTGYDGQVKTDFDTNCVSCHGATNPSKGLRLDSYEAVLAAKDLINTRVGNNTMPVQVVPPATPAPTPTPNPAVTPDPAATPTPAPTPAPVVYQPRALAANAKARILKWVADGAVRTSQTTQQAIRGAQGVQSYETVLVTNWQAAKGSQQRDRRAMPRGPAPLPPEVLGKFLNWEMRGTDWNDTNKQYQNVDGERRRRD